MKNKFFILALTTFLSLLLVMGCSSSATDSKDGDASSAPAAKDGEVTEISFLMLATFEDQLVQLVEDFEEKHPHIKVNANMVAFDRMMETIEVQMSAKEPTFDGLMVDVPLVSNYSAKGYLEPLDQYFDEESQNKWVEVSREDGSYNGQLMAAPMNTSSQILFYNKEIFEKYGITPPSRDERWTWEKIAEVAQQVTNDSNGETFGVTFRYSDNPYQFIPMAHSLGAQLVSNDGLTATGYTNSPEMVEAFQFYYDLFNTWKVSPKVPTTETVEYFSTGKAAMMVGDAAYIQMFEERDVPYDYAPYPYFEGHEVATPTGSFHLGISAFTDKKDAVAEFIKYVTVGEGAKYWFELRNQVPSNRDVIEYVKTDPEFEEFPASAMRIMVEQAESTAVARPRIVGFLEWNNALTDAVNDITNGTDPQTALDNAAEQADRLMEKYKELQK